MKKSVTWIGTMLLTLAIGVLIGQVGKADTPSTPGSADDPIVTKSYVDSKIASLGGNAGSGGSSTGSGSTSSNAFVVVKTTAGQTLLGGVGSEIILRAGTGTAVVNTGASGNVLDISSASDLANGANVTIDHLLLTPQNDGRGVKTVSSVCYFMVRGSYTVQ